MRRRDFIAGLGGAAVVGPRGAWAQRGQRIRRIGMLLALAEDDALTKAELVGFRQGLERLGWSEGRNIQFEYRFAHGIVGQHQALAKELVALQPEVIFAQLTPVAAALQRESNSIPIVFVNVSDPVGSGLVVSLARPGGNLTGLLLYEASITGKWLAMLKEIAPGLTRAALVADPKTPTYDFYLRAGQAIAPSLAIELVPNPVETPADIERAIELFARLPNGGLFMPPSSFILSHRDLVIALAARHHLPAVYPFQIFAANGGLMSYSTDQVEMFRQAATYVDRILRGAKPADLPVQVPSKYETTINLKTAKALGLTVPSGMLVAADEVIE
jgi:putative ABC transport system substrate-binding protein